MMFFKSEADKAEKAKQNTMMSQPLPTKVFSTKNANHLNKTPNFPRCYENSKISVVSSMDTLQKTFLDKAAESKANLELLLASGVDENLLEMPPKQNVSSGFYYQRSMSDGIQAKY